MADTRKRLKSIMKRHALTRADVSSLSGRSIHSVNAWLNTPKSKAHRPIPAEMLQRLEKAVKNGVAS